MKFKLSKIPLDVKLTEKENQEPYSNLFYRSPAEIPGYVYEGITMSPYPEREALLFDDINELLNSGYLPMENGYSFLEDGSIYAAVLTRMPGVTGEMIDWWFWWYPQNPFRFKILYPGAHFDTSLDADIKEFSSRSGPYHQRLWNTTTFPVEDVGMGKDRMIMHFVPPEKFGFDTSRFRQANIETVICGICGSIDRRMKQNSFMCQLVRNTNDGVEVRSRCWIGHSILWQGIRERSFLNRLSNTRTIKKRIIPRKIGRTYCLHCAQEYNNLAGILPELFHEYSG